MFVMTLIHFAILSLRGGAHYNYYHSYADKAALFDWLHSLGLTAAPLATGTAAPGEMLEWLGYIVHADRTTLAGSNVADVANSIINMIGTGTIVIVILLSPQLSKKFGKKAVAVTGFALTAIVSAAMYLIAPTNIGGMVLVTVLWSAVYAPTIPLIWAMFADVVDSKSSRASACVRAFTSACSSRSAPSCWPSAKSTGSLRTRSPTNLPCAALNALLPEPNISTKA